MATKLLVREVLLPHSIMLPPLRLSISHPPTSLLCPLAGLPSSISNTNAGTM